MFSYFLIFLLTFILICGIIVLQVEKSSQSALKNFAKFCKKTVDFCLNLWYNMIIKAKQTSFENKKYFFKGEIEYGKEC